MTLLLLGGAGVVAQTFTGTGPGPIATAGRMTPQASVGIGPLSASATGTPVAASAPTATPQATVRTDRPRG